MIHSNKHAERCDELMQLKKLWKILEGSKINCPNRANSIENSKISDYMTMPNSNMVIINLMKCKYFANGKEFCENIFIF